MRVALRLGNKSASRVTNAIRERGKQLERKSTVQSIHDKIEDDLKQPDSLKVPQSEQKQEYSGDEFEGKKHEEALFSNLTSYHKSKVKDIVSKKGSENITISELNYLHKHFKDLVPNTNKSMKVVAVKKYFGLK
jgi:hypothetical protein